MEQCSACGFEAKSKAGLAAHRRARHGAEGSRGLVEAARSGDQRRALEALRDRLAVEVERVAEDGFCQQCRRGSSSVAPLAKQLKDVLRDLEQLGGEESRADGVDDLAARRASRIAAAQDSARSAEGE